MLNNVIAFLSLKYGLFFRKKNIDKSLQVLESATQKYTKYPYLFLHLGLLYQEKQKYSEAIEYLEKAQSLAIDNPTFDLFMGKILWDQKKYLEAIEVLQKSIKKDSSNQLVWSYLALSFLATGNYKEFTKIFHEKGISENQELQIRIILTLENKIRKWDAYEVQSFSPSE